ncbi:MAG: polyprenyl diphosphate synthase [Acholeplasma sp.]|nr:polyprenyl diphosphate synthase [Acholeplasma sp.]
MYINKNKCQVPEHVAIILDGNGRWAKKRGLPRTFGHYQGGLNVGKIAQKADELGIKILTVYAFSTENWKRPKEEVDFLMETPIKEFEKYKAKILDSNIIFKHVGRRLEIPKKLLDLIDYLEEKTKTNTGLLLQVAFNYGSYDELLNVYHALLEAKVTNPTEQDIWHHLYVKQPVDLLIRTSGEKRLSNYLLWQISYAELYFTKVHWPAFNEKQLLKALKHYGKRDRRFGGLKK